MNRTLTSKRATDTASTHPLSSRGAGKVQQPRSQVYSAGTACYRPAAVREVAFCEGKLCWETLLSAADWSAVVSPAYSWEASALPRTEWTVLGIRGRNNPSWGSGSRSNSDMKSSRGSEDATWTCWLEQKTWAPSMKEEVCPSRVPWQRMKKLHSDGVPVSNMLSTRQCFDQPSGHWFGPGRSVVSLYRLQLMRHSTWTKEI